MAIVCERLSQLVQHAANQKRRRAPQLPDHALDGLRERRHRRLAAVAPPEPPDSFGKSDYIRQPAEGRQVLLLELRYARLRFARDKSRGWIDAMLFIHAGIAIPLIAARVVQGVRVELGAPNLSRLAIDLYVPLGMRLRRWLKDSNTLS